MHHRYTCLYVGIGVRCAFLCKCCRLRHHGLDAVCVWQDVRSLHARSVGQQLCVGVWIQTVHRQFTFQCLSHMVCVCVLVGLFFCLDFLSRMMRFCGNSLIRTFASFRSAQPLSVSCLILLAYSRDLTFSLAHTHTHTHTHTPGTFGYANTVLEGTGEANYLTRLRLTPVQQLYSRHRPPIVHAMLALLVCSSCNSTTSSPCSRLRPNHPKHRGGGKAATQNVTWRNNC